MTKQFEITFDDLNEKAKTEFLEFIGAENEKDFPAGAIAIIEIDEGAAI